MPEVDDNETWKLLEASENRTHTHLKVGRQLNTCDVQDVAIGVSSVHFDLRIFFNAKNYYCMVKRVEQYK